MTPKGPNQTYVKGAHYAHAKAINSVLVAWSPYLIGATSTSVTLVNGSVANTKYVNISTGSYVVGEFSHR